MDHPSVELVGRKRLHTGHFNVDEYLLRHRLYAGGWGEVISRELVDRGRVVAVLPVDVRRDQVVLIEQFRPAAYAVGWEPWMIECVAGILEPGEHPEGVARRESEEEAGLTIGRLHKVMEYLSSPGGSTERVSLFCGEVDAGEAGGIFGLAEEGEDIRVEVVSVEEAVGRLDQGLVVNAKTIIVLQWLSLNYERLKSAWC